MEAFVVLLLLLSFISRLSLQYLLTQPPLAILCVLPGHCSFRALYSVYPHWWLKSNPGFLWCKRDLLIGPKVLLFLKTPRLRKQLLVTSKPDIDLELLLVRLFIDWLKKIHSSECCTHITILKINKEKGTWERELTGTSNSCDVSHNNGVHSTLLLYFIVSFAFVDYSLHHRHEM